MKAIVKKRLKYLFFLILALFIIIQFFPIDKSTPEFDSSGDFIALSNPGDEVTSILKTSCYDCHSFESVYPWYANIAPVSWWIKDHINEGREHLNFSIWSSYTVKRADHKLEEVIEEVEDHAMPLSSYTIIHSDASLSPEQEQELIDFVKKFRATLDIPAEEKED